MSRRANGEGTLYQRADGRWEGAVYVPTPSGARVRRSVYAATRAEAHEKVTALLRQVQQGLPVGGTTVTVQDFLRSWLSDVAKPKLRSSTHEKYCMYVRLYVAPHLGGRRLAKLTAPEVRRWIAVLGEQGLSAATVRQAHAILRSALQHAVREDLLARNVARLVQAPRLSHNEIHPYDVAEAGRLLAAAQDDRLAALWILALGVGMRKGELLGLRWTDVDLDTGTLRVTQTLQRLGGQLRIEAPKTSRSRRTIALPDFCGTALRRHEKAQDDRRAEMGELWRDFGLVFTTGIGTPIEPRNLTRSFNALCDRAGLRRVRFHDLRHSCASLLLALGVEPRVVMEVLGHSAIAVTMNTYTHVMPAMRRDAAARMDRAFGS